MTTTCAIGFSDVRIRYPNETGALAFFSPRNAHRAHVGVRFDPERASRDVGRALRGRRPCRPACSGPLPSLGVELQLDGVFVASTGNAAPGAAGTVSLSPTELPHSLPRLRR